MGRPWTASPASDPATAPGVSKRSGKTPTRKSRAAASSSAVTGSSRMRSSSAMRVQDRRDGDLGVDRGPGRERAGTATQVEPGAGAVRVALRLAQLHVQPGVEQAAEDGAHHRHGMEVGDAPAQADVADADLGLDAARPMHDAHDTTGQGRRVERGRRAPAAPVERVQPPRVDAARASDVLADQVAGHDERGPGRILGPLVGAPDRVAVEALDGLAGAGRRPVIGRGGRVDRADVGLVGPSPRVGLGLEQVVEPLVAQTLDVRGREGRALEDLGQQLEGRPEARGGHVDPDARRVPAGLGVERCAEPLGRLGQGDRVVALGALGQGPGGEDGRAGRPPPARRRHRRAGSGWPSRAAGRAGRRRARSARCRGSPS